MYRLLVVDDEAYITDGLCRLLQGVGEHELDVYKAYSSQKALEFLDRNSVDIVITDIQMPGMSGLELLKEIHDRWPSSRVLLLTGHNAFEYVYQAVRYHVERYILKSEGDEAILAAVEDCIREIDREDRNGKLLATASEQMKLYRPMLRRECLRHALRSAMPAEERASEFARLEIALASARPVLTLAGRLDRYRRGAEDLATSMDILVKERLGRGVVCEMALPDPECMLWLIQPAEDGEYERATVTVRGMAEHIQRSCLQLLDAPLSFVFNQNPVDWEALPGRFSEMRHIVQYRLDPQSEMAFADCAFFLGAGDGDRGSSDIQRLQGFRDKTLELELCLDRSDRDGFNRLLDELNDVLAQVGPGYLAMEVLQSLNLVLISFINKHDLAGQAAADPVLARMPQPGQAPQNVEGLKDIARIGNRLLDYLQSIQKDRGDAFAANIDRYIQANLNADLSLVALSEQVYLNPYYLSRRYKEITGRNISDTIADARMAKAMKLLADNRYKIGEITAKVGYESPAHFSRLFKRHTGMTPQEYRDGLQSRI